MIGTLNEGALHAELKEWYRRPRDRAEEKVEGYVVDLVRGRLLIEIQTGNFAPLRRKLDALLRSSPSPARRTRGAVAPDRSPLRRRRRAVESPLAEARPSSRTSSRAS